MNPTSKTAFVVVELNKGGGETQKFVDTVQERIQSNSSLNDFDVNITGSDSVYHDYNLASEQAVKNVEMIGLPIVFILLLFVFRSVVAASLPIIMGVLSILGTMGILAIISQYMDLSIMVTNIVTMLGLGISIDYALFMVMRFREELDQHGDIQKAIKETVNHTGRSVLFAGITIVVSLSGLFIPNVMFFRSLAVGGVVVVLFTLILTLTFMPAVLKLLGRRINSLSIPYRKTNQKKLRIEKVLKRPILVLR